MSREKLLKACKTASLLLDGKDLQLKERLIVHFYPDRARGPSNAPPADFTAVRSEPMPTIGLTAETDFSPKAQNVKGLQELFLLIMFAVHDIVRSRGIANTLRVLTKPKSVENLLKVTTAPHHKRAHHKRVVLVNGDLLPCKKSNASVHVLLLAVAQTHVLDPLSDAVPKRRHPLDLITVTYIAGKASPHSRCPNYLSRSDNCHIFTISCSQRLP